MRYKQSPSLILCDPRLPATDLRTSMAPVRSGGRYTGGGAPYRWSRSILARIAIATTAHPAIAVRTMEPNSVGPPSSSSDSSLYSDSRELPGARRGDGVPRGPGPAGLGAPRGAMRGAGVSGPAG
eukprot:CAMPEP_0198693450 /NCGR_PEP_ID=MMETSP1468-20131203/250484_1 /TAXON_ID=1461545 /ORGANISM="Mantoniella sp, Strain CCMP1436" /LENGTH=124 /DNA_ID=CAMNT_0044448113 /DNA_START=521 /DNA_END=892 /DNA_ORIENTATION=+